MKMHGFNDKAERFARAIPLASSFRAQVGLPALSYPSVGPFHRNE
jgi:hypothetical protein